MATAYSFFFITRVSFGVRVRLAYKTFDLCPKPYDRTGSGPHTPFECHGDVVGAFTTTSIPMAALVARGLVSYTFECVLLGFVIVITI
jgi:hypothetical protein